MQVQAGQLKGQRSDQGICGIPVADNQHYQQWALEDTSIPGSTGASPWRPYHPACVGLLQIAIFSLLTPKYVYTRWCSNNLGWLLIIGGIVWYFVWSGIGAAVFVRSTDEDRRPVPGAGDVPRWISGVTVLGALALIGSGIAVLV